MTSRRIDQFLVALGLLLILVSSSQLFFTSTKSEDGPSLGTLLSTMSVVKTKNALSLDWRDAVSGNDLKENQLIYTDNRSSAEIKFTSGGELIVGENSLIKLQTIGTEQGMNLSKGFIRAKLEANRPLKLQMNGADYLLSGNEANIQINLQNDKGEIGVLSGKVQIEGNGVKEDLNEESALNIDGRNIKKVAIHFKLLNPKQADVVYTDAPMEQIQFAWSPEERAAIKIGPTQDLKDSVANESESGKSLSLSPGLYYYKVENENGSSLIRQFRIVKEEAPQVLRPLTGDELEVIEGQNSSVLLQWKDENKLNYEVQWDDGKSHLESVTGSTTLIPVSQTGRIKWRIRIKDEKRPKAIWGDWQDFKVNMVQLPVVPSRLSPNGIEFQTYEVPNEEIELKWDNPLSTDIELVDPKGETITARVIENKYIYHATLAGTYRWRARAVDNFLRVSEWTPWVDFTVMDLSKEVSKEGVQLIQLKRPDQSVTFSWKSPAGAVTVFELSKDQKFSEIVKKKEVSGDSVKVSIPTTGTYYWRSREFLTNGTIQVSEPRRVIIEPTPAPEKPGKLPDIEIPIEELPIKSGFIKNVFELILPTAHADELKGLAHISLPAKEEAKAYVVRIYRDKELRELVFEKEITSKDFTWDEAIPGTYYWQYAVIDYWDRKSLFSDPSILVISGELIPQAVKPRLLSPIRAKEIGLGELRFRWTDSKENTHYTIEISDKRSFENIISKKESKDGKVQFDDLNLSPKLYFWRVRAFDKKEREIKSNTGRFVITPPLERTVIVDQVYYQKKWKKRLTLSWNPSMDGYNFKQDGQSGKINGNVLNGLSFSGTYFFKKGILNGEIVRQSGKVFKNKDYLFQRLSADYIYSWDIHGNHKFGAGVMVAQTGGQSYGVESGAVTAKATSSLGYGVIFRDYLSFNERWEMQSKLLYLAGDISQLEIGTDALWHRSQKYFLLGGIGFASRSYSTHSGSQSSIQLKFGIGKEF